MNELYDQAIEKLTAAQIRGFESLETLKKRYKLDVSKDKPKNVIVELLKVKSAEAPDLPAEPDIELTPILKDQLQKRRLDQQDVSSVLLL